MDSQLPVPEGYSHVPTEEAEKVFHLEIDSWCYGLSRFPEVITSKLIHALVKEMSGCFLYGVKNHFAFDLIEVAQKIHQACEGVVNEKEIALHLIACLPNPASLDAECLATFKEIIANTEKTYPDVVRRFESRIKKAIPENK